MDQWAIFRKVGGKDQFYWGPFDQRKLADVYLEAFGDYGKGMTVGPLPPSLKGVPMSKSKRAALTAEEVGAVVEVLDDYPKLSKGKWGKQGPLFYASSPEEASEILQKDPEESYNGNPAAYLATYRGDLTPEGLKRAAKDCSDYYYTITGGRDLYNYDLFLVPDFVKGRLVRFL